MLSVPENQAERVRMFIGRPWRLLVDDIEMNLAGDQYSSILVIFTKK